MLLLVVHVRDLIVVDLVLLVLLAHDDYVSNIIPKQTPNR